MLKKNFIQRNIDLRKLLKLGEPICKNKIFSYGNRKIISNKLNLDQTEFFNR